MNSPQAQPQSEDNGGKLSRINRYAPVYDETGEEIGEVIRIHLPGQFDQHTELAENTSPVRMVDDDLLVPDKQMTDEIPGAVLARMREHGFVEIRGGLLQANHYVVPDQIARIDKDGVHLRVRKDRLIRST